jgi:hypothetical protein
MRAFAQKPKAAHQTTSAKSTIPGRAHLGPSCEANSIPNLQRTIGNQAVQRLLEEDNGDVKGDATTIGLIRFGHGFSRVPVHTTSTTKIQAKLMANASGGDYEQEADAIANQLAQRGAGQMAGTYTPATEAHRVEPSPSESVVQSYISRSRGRGEPLLPDQRAYFESRLGHNFEDVRVHAGEESSSAARALNARAFTFGTDIHFGPGAYAPLTGEGFHLLAHELVHTVQQNRGLMLQRKPDTARGSFPWIGRIDHTSSASLRKTPAKDPDDPHSNTLADLPKGTEVAVVGQAGGWMHVQVSLDDKTLSGYVSTELITYVKASAFELPEIVIEMKFPTIAEAFVELKRAEKRKAKQGAAFKPTDEEQSRIDLAIIVLKGTKKYAVDETTFEVDFAAQTGKAKTKITTIEDFILFVEQVEKQYPSAAPKEVASEVRQMWFSDPNWEILSAGSGISQGGKVVDIETEPDPIASRFDMPQVAPAKGSLQLDTRMGRVDIGHVMSGIDVRLSGFPASYLESLHGKKVDPSDLEEGMLKYNTLKTASGGNTLDFATWAGDLGQAYAEYLVDRYVKENTSASLKTFAAEKAPPDELRGDIQGYIAVDVYKKVPPSVSPTGMESKVSNILRDMFLVDKPASGETMQTYFEQVSGKSSSELKPFITERSLRFARPWYAKKAVDERGWLGSEGWTKQGILENTLKDFDKKHNDNEKNASKDNKLEVLIDSLLQQLSAPIK